MAVNQLLRIERVGDVIDVGELDVGGPEAIVDRVVRQLPGRERQRPLAVLDAREALFLGGGDDASIHHQAGGRVVVNGVDSPCDHAAGRSSRAASATLSGATPRRHSWCPAGQTLL